MEDSASIQRHETESVRDVVGSARARELDWIILTPHSNTRDNALRFFWDAFIKECKYYQRKHTDILILVGQEGYLWDKQGNADGHVLVYGNNYYLDFHDEEDPRGGGSNYAEVLLVEGVTMFIPHTLNGAPALADEAYQILYSDKWGHTVTGLEITQAMYEKMLTFINNWDCRTYTEEQMRQESLWDYLLLFHGDIAFSIATSDAEKFQHEGLPSEVGKRSTIIFPTSFPTLPAPDDEAAWNAWNPCSMNAVIEAVVDGHSCGVGPGLLIYMEVVINGVRYGPGSTVDLVISPEDDVTVTIYFEGAANNSEVNILLGDPSTMKLSEMATLITASYRQSATFTFKGKDFPASSYLRAQVYTPDFIAFTNPIFFGPRWPTSKRDWPGRGGGSSESRRILVRYGGIAEINDPEAASELRTLAERNLSEAPPDLTEDARLIKSVLPPGESADSSIVIETTRPVTINLDDGLFLSLEHLELTEWSDVILNNLVRTIPELAFAAKRFLVLMVLSLVMWLFGL
jgi:hypothetical protein